MLRAILGTVAVLKSDGMLAVMLPAAFVKATIVISVAILELTHHLHRCQILHHLRAPRKDCHLRKRTQGTGRLQGTIDVSGKSNEIDISPSYVRQRTLSLFRLSRRSGSL